MLLDGFRTSEIGLGGESGEKALTKPGPSILTARSAFRPDGPQHVLLRRQISRDPFSLVPRQCFRVRNTGRHF